MSEPAENQSIGLGGKGGVHSVKTSLTYKVMLIRYNVITNS